MSHRWACLLGHPVAHSLSPALHNAAFAALGIDAHYEARDVAPSDVDVASAVQALRHADCYGANVTAPHKQAVVPFMDELSDEVRALGVLNTIVNTGGRLGGMNTDARGFGRWMREVGIDAHGANALVLGAGGAARAVVWALGDAGAARIVVLNRTLARADELVGALEPHVKCTPLEAGPLEAASAPGSSGRAWDIVLNATSLGHHGQAPVVHPSCYSPASVAIELAYNPPVTEFMTSAREAGARAENGLGMLLHQAALSFECWTGESPPLAVLEAALRSRVAV
jgi:shikimate dehydrogenase